MADIIGTNNAIKIIELNEATSFAIYKDYKQNATPIFKHEGKQNAKCIQVFKDIANSIGQNEYEVVIWKDGENNDVEKIRFTFINDIPKQEPKVEQIQTSLNSNVELIEARIENKFLKEKVNELNDEIAALGELLEKYEKEVAILKESVKDPKQGVYERLNLLLDQKVLNINTQKSQPALAENNSENSNKKELAKELISVVFAKFNESEVKKLIQFVKENSQMIKSYLK